MCFQCFKNFKNRWSCLRFPLILLQWQMFYHLAVRLVHMVLVVWFIQSKKKKDLFRVLLLYRVLCRPCAIRLVSRFCLHHKCPCAQESKRDTIWRSGLSNMNWFEQGSNYSGREDLVRSNYVCPGWSGQQLSPFEEAQGRTVQNIAQLFHFVTVWQAMIMASMCTNGRNW